MRLSIRPEQLMIVETFAQENFVRRIAAHLRSEYSQATVTLPTDEEFTVSVLPEERLYDLVRTGIVRARLYAMKLESSIAAFIALMFEVSPNFDEHRLCQVLLNDEQVAPDARIDELLNILTEKNWESIRVDYDPQAWMLPEEEPEPPATEVTPPIDEPKNLDMQETVKNFP